MEERVIGEIIEYWNLIEFLNQAEYPYVKAEKNSFKMTISHSLTEIRTFDAMLQIDSEKYQKLPVISKNYDICLGKIDRESCMKCAYELSKQKDERIE